MFKLIFILLLASLALCSPVTVSKLDPLKVEQARVGKVRAVENCTDVDSKKAFIVASYGEAKVLASNAYNYLTTLDYNIHYYAEEYFETYRDAFYQAYFGYAPVLEVRDVFASVIDNYPAFNLDCQCNGTQAAFPVNGSIHYCDGFFNGTYVPTSDLYGKPSTNKAARGSVTLHELVHVIARIGDISPADNGTLPDEQKVSNAINYVHFADRIYQNPANSGSSIISFKSCILNSYWALPAIVVYVIGGVTFVFGV